MKISVKGNLNVTISGYEMTSFSNNDHEKCDMLNIDLNDINVEMLVDPHELGQIVKDAISLKKIMALKDKNRNHGNRNKNHDIQRTNNCPKKCEF